MNKATLTWVLVATLTGCGGDDPGGLFNAPPAPGAEAGPDADANAGGNGGDASLDAPDGSPDAPSEESGQDACTPGPIAAVDQPCCTPSELACAGHAQKLVLICQQSTMTWAPLQGCSGQQLCDTTPGANQGSCQDPVASCIGHQPGDKVCDGLTSIECGPDLLTSTETSCTYACEAGECTGECLAGDRRCNDTTPEACDAGGQWQSEAPCPYLCSAQGACTGECTAGAKQCNDKTPQTCNATAVWVDGAPCANVCSGGQCVSACNDGDKQCWGIVPQTCVGGAWQNGTACPSVCSAGNCTGVCLPGAKQCSGNVPQTCDANGQWQSGSACSYVCSGGSCTGSCVPGSKLCNGTTPQICDTTGQWQTGSSCPFVCSGGDCTGVCVPGSKQCSGNVPQTCNASGQWDSGSVCPYQCSSGQCVAACTEGSKQCSGLVPQTCVNSNWQSGAECSYVCSNGDCAGVCAPGSKQCSGNTLQTCQSTGQWDSGIGCSGSTPVCSGGQCVDPPSCAGGLTCAGVSCCSSLLVPGGTFPMGRSVSGTDACPSGMTCGTYEQPEHNATVANFYLDKYEATVGRFRRFVQQYTGTPPAEGAGAHPMIPGSGWQSAWNANLPSSQADLISKLKCQGPNQTWTDAVGSHETYPINCVNWYEAFAFCAWDGARLSTEAEWEYAAAGGIENRLYPWGQQAPDATRGNYSETDHSPLIGVGIHPAGAGPWGHQDFGGNMREWVLDWFDSAWYSGGGASCNNCANLTANTTRAARGASWYYDGSRCRSAFRNNVAPLSHLSDTSFRCARNP